MAEHSKITFGRLKHALLSCGYVNTHDKGHEVFRHPDGVQVAIFPALQDHNLVRLIHLKIAESTIRDDGIADVDEFRFFLKHGKKQKDLIQKGDQLVWTTAGKEIPVIAASTEEDGIVIIKQKRTFSACPASELRVIAKANAN